ncbi:hypothetical protein Acr_17g0005300 [Actinidia rufa]|uniref:Uncharacterized protein n=1 Tax=Actinidia rufa TaxID=165716 RepID=A0A7J0G2H6_9ERIC|nr:hypothetical protein Acr_17g0005300 [Actinidia rufa]
MVHGGIYTFGAGVDLSRRVRAWRDEVTRTPEVRGCRTSVEGVRANDFLTWVERGDCWGPPKLGIDLTSKLGVPRIDHPFPCLLFSKAASSQWSFWAPKDGLNI